METKSPENFWEINWSDLPPCDTSGPFFTQDDFEKNSVVYKKELLNLFGICLRGFTNEKEDNVKSSVGKPSGKKAPQKAEKISSLTANEQQLYLSLLQKYCKRICTNPTDEERKEIQKLAELQGKVALEQIEVIQHLKEHSTSHLYQFIHPEALQFIKLLLKEKLDYSLLTYPRHYCKFEEDITLVSSDDTADATFVHQRTLLELGKLPRLVNLTLEKPCILPLDCTKVNKRFPVTRTNANCHPSRKPVSEDSIAKSLAQNYDFRFVLSTSSLKTLLDNHSPYLREWELPIKVEEYKDSVGIKKVVYIDKALPTTKMSGRERNYLYHKYALKSYLTHFNPTRGRLVQPSDADKCPSNRFEKRVLSFMDSDLFGSGGEDITDLETFGMATISPDKHSSRFSSKTTDCLASTKNVVSESPASPDAKNVVSESPASPDARNVVSESPASPDALEPPDLFRRPLTIPVENDSDPEGLVIDLNPLVKRETTSTDLQCTFKKPLMIPVESDSESVGQVVDPNHLVTCEMRARDFPCTTAVQDSNAQSDEYDEKKPSEKVTAKSEEYKFCDSDSDDLVIDTSTSDCSFSTLTAEKIEDQKTEVVIPVRRSPRNHKPSSAVTISPSRKRRQLQKTEESESPMVLRSRKNVTNDTEESHKANEVHVQSDSAKNIAPSVAEDIGDSQLNAATTEQEPVKPTQVMDQGGDVGNSQPNAATSEQEPVKPTQVMDQAGDVGEARSNTATSEQESVKQTKFIDRAPTFRCSGDTTKNLLDSIFEMQDKLLPTQKMSMDVTDKGEGHLQAENPSNYETPDSKDNFSYSLFSLKDLKLMIRHKTDCLRMPSRRPCFLYPKLEYHSGYGGETTSESELIHQWVSLLLKSESEIVRARINASTSSLLMLESVDANNLKSSGSFQPKVQVQQMASVLESLKKLPTGRFILLHKKLEPKVSLYKATDSNSERGTFDLHTLLRQRLVEASDGLKTSDTTSCFLPIDPEVLLPSLVKCHRVPATFKPRDSTAAFRKEVSGDICRKRKKKAKKKK